VVDRAHALSSGRPEDGLAWLQALPASNIKMGLSRVREALAALGDPQAHVPSLQVAGTNGKGSTCAFAAACLSQRYRTGRYISPHLERVNERISIDGVDISDEVLGRRVLEVLARLPETLELTYFEFGTVVAFWHFAQEQVDVAVLETGLGGRLDATTACDAVVTAITSISFDHQEYLGHTLAAIAAEKAGIVKRGVPLVTCAQPPEVLEVFRAVTSAEGAPLFVEGADFRVEGTTWRGLTHTVSSLRWALEGPHQRQNLAVALAALEQLAARGFPLSDEELRRGLAAARWPGRFERFSGAPELVLDGAHNPAGVEVLCAALDEAFAGRAVHLVFGVFGDKAWAPMARRLFTRCARLYLAPVGSPRGLSPEALAPLAHELGVPAEVFPSAEAALAQARAVAPPDAVVVVAGSLFLLGQLRPLARGAAAH
jgi:dihydrofolate synthase/folylpolyglutamate synthase